MVTRNTISAPQGRDQARIVDGDAMDDILRFMTLEGWRLEPTEFLAALVERLGRALGMAYAFCDSIDPGDPTQVETLALFARGRLVENIRYSLAGTPCEEVIGQNEACYARNIQARFPNDHALAEMGAESYAGVPLWGTGGKPLGLIGVIDDEPLRDWESVMRLLRLVAVRAGPELERIRIIEDLRHGEHRFRDFAAVSSDWFWETDSALRFSWFSDRFEEVSGVDPGQLLGKRRDEIGAPGADPEAYRALLSDMAARRPFRDFQHHRIHPDGRMVHLSISGMPAFDGNGDFIGYRGVGRDVTADKESQIELVRSRDEATRANHAKSEFLASMSHELRTPLNAIQGMSEALLTISVLRDDPVKLEEYLRAIQSSSRHLTELIEDVLDLSRIEAGRTDVHPEHFDPGPEIEQTILLLEALRERMNARISYVSEIDGMEIRADRRLFRQVMLNLIGNSLKHGGKGVAVSVSVSRDRRDDLDSLIVSIADTGPGFPEAAREKIGQPFVTRTDTALSGGERSVGLGLSIVVRLMRLNDGILTIGRPASGALVETSWPLS